MSAIGYVSDFFSYFLTFDIIKCDANIFFVGIIASGWLQLKRGVSDSIQNSYCIFLDLFIRGRTLSLNDALCQAEVKMYISVSVKLEIETLNLEARRCYIEILSAF